MAGMVQTSGFLVPGKSDGHLEVFDTTSGEPDGPWDIAAGQSDSWSYHWVHWKVTIYLSTHNSKYLSVYPSI